MTDKIKYRLYCEFSEDSYKIESSCNDALYDENFSVIKKYLRDGSYESAGSYRRLYTKDEKENILKSRSVETPPPSYLYEVAAYLRVVLNYCIYEIDTLTNINVIEDSVDNRVFDIVKDLDACRKRIKKLEDYIVRECLKKSEVEND